MDKKSLFTAAGLKATPARLHVLDTLYGSETPLSARALWQQLPERKIGFATVYRALSALCEAGLARKILSDNQALYESAPPDTGPQLVCSRCGKVEDITDPTILRYNTDVIRQRGLSKKNALMMYADCRRKQCRD